MIFWELTFWELGGILEVDILRVDILRRIQYKVCLSGSHGNRVLLSGPNYYQLSQTVAYCPKNTCHQIAPGFLHD